MIFVVIPCYKVTRHVLGVIESIPPIVDKIIAVDDCCPDNSGQFIKDNCKDPRIEVIIHAKNKGVGGALITGYKRAIEIGQGIVVKLDGDGQMDPRFIPTLISPIQKGKADYTKGNRFYFIRSISVMPKVRIAGNMALSFINKVVTGYWNIMDPTNGYTAIHTKCLSYIPLDRVANNYFFESDMLFRLSTISAVVRDVPMLPKYDDEESNLSIVKTLKTFPILYLVRFAKRIVYNYFLRDFNIGSLFLIPAVTLLIFGSIFGAFHWYDSIITGTQKPTGTIMISVISVIVGFQSLLFFLQHDISMIPNNPLSEGELK